jgi:2-C-methyl-D-erythritol 4-phosphate cytidylyltransferase
MAPDAQQFVIHPDAAENTPPPLGKGRVGASVTVLAVPVTDTCKEVVDGLVRRTIPRDTLVDARGPWTFQREALIQALDRAGNVADISNLIELCQAARLRVRVLIAQ